MILNTDAGVTHKGNCFCFSCPYVSLADLAHDWSLLVRLNKADWSRRKLLWNGGAGRREEGGRRAKMKTVVIVDAIFSTAFGEWLKICKHQKLRFGCGFSLLRVVKCLLMPRSGEPSPVPQMNTHPLIFFDLKYLSVVRLQHTWLLNPRLFQLHLTWLPPFDYSALTWSWGHQRKEGEIICSCSNLGLHLLGLGLPLLYPAATNFPGPYTPILCSPRCVIPYSFCRWCSDCQREIQMRNLEAKVSFWGLILV